MELYLLIVGFFIVSVALAWLFIFPAGRHALSGVAMATGFRAFAWIGRLGHALVAIFGGIAVRVARAIRATVEFLSHNRRLVAGWVLLMCLPPLLITQCHYDLGSAETASVQNTAAIDQALISSLLRGERLAPPPAPVPAVFETREVKRIRPKLPEANRDWSQLKSEFRQRLLVVYKLMKQKYGYNMILIEGYRSPTRQKMLGKLKSGVTNAGAFESYHQYGLAADSAFMRDGELIISAQNNWAMRGYRLYGRLAEAVGLTWGGDWSLHDYGHVELRRPDVLGQH